MQKFCDKIEFHLFIHKRIIQKRKKFLQINKIFINLWRTKVMKRLILITFMMLISLDFAGAQLINKWVSLDSLQAYYHSPIPWRTKNIVSYDRDNLIVIEQTAANARPFLKYSPDAGETWERFLEDGSFVYNYNSLDYPDKDIMYVVGDSSEFLKSES